MSIEELRVIITGEVSDLKASIQEAKRQIGSLETSTKKSVGGITKSFTSLAKNITASFKSISRIVTKVLSVAALVAFGKSAIELASDVEEV